MRAFRLITCAALALPASACTIWYLATNPYGDASAADADVDAQGLADAADDVIVGATFENVLSNVTAITTYQDKLYANVGGQVYVCDPTCTQITFADASAAGRGIAVDDVGIYWTASGGIWVAQTDGGGATQPIDDSNNPQVVAVDGTRVSWTTRDDAGKAVIHSCAKARSGCKFPPLSGGTGDSGATNGTGEGGATQLGPSGVVDGHDLAAGPGYVAWVTQADQSVSFTFVDGGTVALPVPNVDPLFDTLDSARSYVASDGTKVFLSYYNKSNTILIRQTGLPNDAAIGTKIYYNSGVKQNYCLAAGAGRIVFGGTTASVYTADETTGTSRTQYDFPDSNAATACAVTSTHVFVIDNGNTLYRVARSN